MTDTARLAEVTGPPPVNQLSSAWRLASTQERGNAIIASVQRELGHQLHPLADRVARDAESIAFERPNVDVVAARLGYSGRHLERRFLAAWLPPPHRLIVLTRWLVVARELAAAPDTRSRDIATELRFSCTAALCKAARRETCFSVRELRTAGAADRLARDILTAYGASLATFLGDGAADGSLR